MTGSPQGPVRRTDTAGPVRCVQGLAGTSGELMSLVAPRLIRKTPKSRVLIQSAGCPAGERDSSSRTSCVPEVGCLVFLHGTVLISRVGKSTVQRRVEREGDASHQGCCARVVLSGGGAGGLLWPRSRRAGARRAVRPRRVLVPQARGKLRVRPGSLLGLRRPRETQVSRAVSFRSRPGGGGCPCPGPGLLRLEASGKGQ